MMPKKEIIKRLMQHYGCKTLAEFAAFLGVATTTISSWKKRDSIDWELICAKCSELNLDKLMREGEVCVKPPPPEKNDQVEYLRLAMNMAGVAVDYPTAELVSRLNHLVRKKGDDLNIKAVTEIEHHWRTKYNIS